MEAPETRYAKSDDGLSIAYQTLGSGPRDIVFMPYPAGIEGYWDEPTLARCLKRLAGVGRVVCFDERGTGASDPSPFPTPEAWMDDIRIVLDEIGSTRAGLVAHGPPCSIAMFFAATYPERTDALILIDGFARVAWAEDYRIGALPEQVEWYLAQQREHFGTGRFWVSLLAPSRAGDETLRRWMARQARSAFSPATAAAANRWIVDLDVRSILSSIRVPTLVMHHRRSRMLHVAHSEYLVEHIKGARLKLIPGADVYFFAETADAVIDEIEEFITGAPAVREPDRVLATVLFTDIVSSTERAAATGDKQWRRLLDQHDALVGGELVRHRGRKVNPTGDGMLATFDGPARAVRCAQAICAAVQPLGIEIRAGLHTGEVELRGDDIGGIAVHIGQCVSALAGPGEVLVSRTVTDLVAGSGLQFEERGEYELKGVPGKWAIYAVRS